MTSPEENIEKNIENLEFQNDQNEQDEKQEDFKETSIQIGLSKPGSSKQIKAQVKPFTKESLDRLENKTVQLVREYGFQPRRKLSVEDGSVLPGKYEPFPSKLYGRPLEEIDNFIYDEVGGGVRMCFVSIFNAQTSLSVLSVISDPKCVIFTLNIYLEAP